MVIFTSYHVFLFGWVSSFRLYSTSFGCDPDRHSLVLFKIWKFLLCAKNV